MSCGQHLWNQFRTASPTVTHLIPVFFSRPSTDIDTRINGVGASGQLGWTRGSTFLLPVPLTLTNLELPAAHLGVLWDVTMIIMLHWYAREPGHSVLTYFLGRTGGIGWCEGKSRVAHAFPLRFSFKWKFSKVWLIVLEVIWYAFHMKIFTVH